MQSNRKSKFTIQSLQIKVYPSTIQIRPLCKFNVPLNYIHKIKKYRDHIIIHGFSLGRCTRVAARSDDKPERNGLKAESRGSTDLDL